MATSVFVVLLPSLSASVGHLVRFALVGGSELRKLLSLVILPIPGVILGGQLGLWVDSRFPQRALEGGLHILLLLVATLTPGEAGY